MCDFTDFITFSNARNDTCFVKKTFDQKREWLTSSREIWSQMRCAILPSSLLAMLIMIPVLLNRLFGGEHSLFL